MTFETPLVSMQAVCSYEQEIHIAEQFKSFSYSNLLALEELECQIKGVEMNQVFQLGYSVLENTLSIFIKNIYDNIFLSGIKLMN